MCGCGVGEFWECDRNVPSPLSHAMPTVTCHCHAWNVTSAGHVGRDEGGLCHLEGLLAGPDFHQDLVAWLGAGG